jgi:hypothetical protein
VNLSELAEQDAMRAILPATEIFFQDGEMLLSEKGLRMACEAVIEGRLEGDPDAALSVLNSLINGTII